MSKNGWTLCVNKQAGGAVVLSLYERHAPDEPGQIIEIELGDYELERLHLVTGQALWDRVRKC